MNRRVVVTGMGAVTPIGNNVGDFWQGLKAGECGIDFITAFDTEQNKVKLAAEVKLDLTEHIKGSELRKMDRFTALGIIAARECLSDSGITAENADLNRCGVLVSSGIGGLNSTEKEHSRGLEKGFDRVSPFYIPMTIANMAAGRIAIESGFKAHCSATVTACAGGNNAIGDAMRMIRHGYADAMMAGGTEGCITPLSLGGFTSMKALCESTDPARASIPFDKERSGFVMGEGAGILMLEELEHAKARGAKIYGEVTGYGVTCDAYHITAPEPNGEGGARAMVLAIEDAGLKPEDIEYVNAHGTSTPLNDKGETTAVKTAFGEHAYKLAMSSTKSMTGHLLGAAGAIEAIACVLAIENSYAPPTINYKEKDEDCDLDIIPNVGRDMEINHALSNSLGFGGHNASVVISKYKS